MCEVSTSKLENKLTAIYNTKFKVQTICFMTRDSLLVAQTFCVDAQTHILILI